MGKLTLTIITLSAIMIGCASIHDKVMVTPVAGENSIPRKIAIYPLLTSEQVLVVSPHDRRVRLLSAETKVREDRSHRDKTRIEHPQSTFHQSPLGRFIQQRIYFEGVAGRNSGRTSRKQGKQFFHQPGDLEISPRRVRSGSCPHRKCVFYRRSTRQVACRCTSGISQTR